MTIKQLSSVAPGTLISYRRRHATVLEHLPHGVFVQLVDPIERCPFGSSNDWRKSDLRQYLNGEFACQLCEGSMGELLDTATDLTAMDGTIDYGYSVDKVTLLTLDQCRKYRYIRPLPSDPEWMATPASTPGGWDIDGDFVSSLRAKGYCCLMYRDAIISARPAFTLPSNIHIILPQVNEVDNTEELPERRRDCEPS